MVTMCVFLLTGRQDLGKHILFLLKTFFRKFLVRSDRFIESYLTFKLVVIIVGSNVCGVTRHLNPSIASILDINVILNVILILIVL